MAVEVLETILAEKQVRALRGTPRKRYSSFLDELAASGCTALGYRLTGDAVEHLCVKHLHGALRVVVAFERPDRAWVLLVGPHNDLDPGTDVYTQLWVLAGLNTPPAGERTKPPCCGQDGAPPAMDSAEFDDLLTRARKLASPGRQPARR